ncbi:MAG: orotate phosphoribosyltransferase [Clostridiales bacterium]|nr:orotate phosphoribosyltransferase [Clostridiales bacterium]
MRCREKCLRFLLEYGALTFGEFTLKNGRRSPYMVNTGELAAGAALSRLGCFYARTIYEEMEHGVIPESTNILFGSAYKGIPLVAATAIAMMAAFGHDIGYCFNRKEEKSHGEGGIFVGKKPGAGDRVLIVDDTLTSGTALRDTVDLLQLCAPEAKVVGAIIAIDRKERGRDPRLTVVAETQYELGFPIFSIIDIDEIVTMLKSESYLTCKNTCDAKEPDCSYRAGVEGRAGRSLEEALPDKGQIAAVEEYLEFIRPK